MTKCLQLIDLGPLARAFCNILVAALIITAACLTTNAGENLFFISATGVAALLYFTAIELWCDATITGRSQLLLIGGTIGLILLFGYLPHVLGLTRDFWVLLYFVWMFPMGALYSILYQRSVASSTPESSGQ